MKSKHLNFVPVKSDRVSWYCSEQGKVTLKVRNRGVFNIICQKLFSTPKISRIGLDDIGSRVWLLIDGTRTVMEIGRQVDICVGKDAHPVYERLLKYIGILKENKMIIMKKGNSA